MSLLAPAVEAPASITVNMGQVAIARSPTKLITVLGSCIGVLLYHPRLRVAALSHVVLPTSKDRAPATPCKFADTAIPHMLTLLQKEGALASGLIAKIAGGASMFSGNGPLQVGESNATAVSDALCLAKIRVVGDHLGGQKGRRVTIDPATGEMLIEIVGQEGSRI